MKRLLLLLSALMGLASPALAKTPTPAELDLIAWQQKIDDAVVATDLAFLQGAFTEDFHFKHGTGKEDTKQSWLESVEKNRGGFVSRIHSDVEAEIHGDIGITQGKLTVTRKNQSYLLLYVRVYVHRDGRWQMLSHRTVVQQGP
jgi:hypothetical protein